MIKKYLKELIYLAIMFFIATNVIGYFRSSSVKSDNIELLKNYSTIDKESLSKILNSNKVKVLNFWGTWCPVCNQEVSTLSKLAKNKNVTLITIASNSGSNKDIKEYMEKKGVKYLVINDFNGQLTKKFNISVFPTTIFYSKNLNHTISDSGYITYAGFLARVKYMERKDDK